MKDRQKEQERAQLHRTIWNIADHLRGAVDGWDFKQYILVMLFYRYISENITNYINNQLKASEPNFDYLELPDSKAEELRAKLVSDKGFFILPSQLFHNLLKNAPNDENLNGRLEQLFRAIEESTIGSGGEENFKGLFGDLDVNSNKLGSTIEKRNEKLIKLLEGIGALQLGDLKERSIDAFGDAYEYLMTMYASNAGKSGGEFYTPQEVSELLARLTIVGKEKVDKVYDPACGSGSLLLKFAKILGKERVRDGFYGQELNLTTYNICRINMFLHDIDYRKFHIANEDTLTDPKYGEAVPFDAIVSNPPYSIKWAGDTNKKLLQDPRFAPAGVLAPKSKADLAFIMHSLSYLASDGTAAVVCFPGVMYRCGAERKIRRYLIEQNFVDAIIQLPNNLFFGTSIATCIVVLKKNKLDKQTLFIDATNEFVKVTNNNKLTDENIQKILQLYIERKDVKYLAKLVSSVEIAKQDYNLSVSTYVEKEDETEQIDIIALNREIAELVEREQELRTKIDQIISEIDLTFEDV